MTDSMAGYNITIVLQKLPQGVKIMPAYCLYFIYTAIMAVVLFALVPRDAVKRLFVYAVTFGGVADALVIFFIKQIIKAGEYINYGPFGLLGIPFFPPIAWTIWFLMFFYFLPDDLIWMVIYVLTAAAASVMFSNVLANLNIFTWHYSKIFIPFLIYLSWFAASTWAFKRLNKQHP
jgi:hypothetical protein